MDMSVPGNEEIPYFRTHYDVKQRFYMRKSTKNSIFSFAKVSNL